VKVAISLSIPFIIFGSFFPPFSWHFKNFLAEAKLLFWRAAIYKFVAKVVLGAYRLLLIKYFAFSFAPLHLSCSRTLFKGEETSITSNWARKSLSLSLMAEHGFA
jgi:hypothetical protein